MVGGPRSKSWSACISLSSLKGILPRKEWRSRIILCWCIKSLPLKNLSCRRLTPKGLGLGLGCWNIILHSSSISTSSAEYGESDSKWSDIDKEESGQKWWMMFPWRGSLIVRISLNPLFTSSKVSASWKKHRMEIYLLSSTYLEVENKGDHEDPLHLAHRRHSATFYHRQGQLSKCFGASQAGRRDLIREACKR